MEKTGSLHQRLNRGSKVVGELLVDAFHHLALFALLPSREIADRPQLALLVHREQVHVQH